MSRAFDIVVIGSGAAGIAAAVSSARAGRATLLLDKNPAPGGTGGLSGLTTLCGLYDEAGNFLNDGFTREFANALTERQPPAQLEPEAIPSKHAGPETGAPIKMGRVWVRPYRPEKFREAAAHLLSSTPNLQPHWQAPLANVSVANDRIVSVNGFNVGAVIDCSGSAEVAQAGGAECLETDETTQATAVIFPLHHVTPEIHTPAEAVKLLLPLARAGFPPINFQANLEPNSLTAKFTGQPAQVPALIEFLRTNIRGFENCSTPLKEFSVARRAGRMIVGEYVLTGADVLGGRKFHDAVARGAWPIEQWNAAGQARLRYLPLGAHYEIPARSLRAAKIENLFMAGKTISADANAIGSARVMGCCLATGAAAGVLAAKYLDSQK